MFATAVSAGGDGSACVHPDRIWWQLVCSCILGSFGLVLMLDGVIRRPQLIEKNRVAIWVRFCSGFLTFFSCFARILLILRHFCSLLTFVHF